MGAAAAARTAPRTAPAPAPRRRQTSPRRVPQSTPLRQPAPRMNVYRSRSASTHAAAGLVPLAAGRAAVAVRELPDSGLIQRLVRGRLRIGVLSVMLAGIVALNVLSLGLTSRSGRVGEQIAALQRSNSALRANIAERLSSSRVQEVAAVQGLAVPASSDITYLRFNPGDYSKAAETLGGTLVAQPSTDSTTTADATAASDQTTSTAASSSSSSSSSSSDSGSSTQTQTQTQPSTGASAPPASSGGTTPSGL